MHELLSQPGITRTADALVLKYATTSILFWCCLPLVAAALGTAGLLFVRYHKQRADAPSPSAVPVTIFSFAALLLAVVQSTLLLPAVILTEIRVTSTEATQDVGLWWAKSIRRFPYDDIMTISVTTAQRDSGPEPVWEIVWRGGEIESFNPGNLWSTNQQLIRERMQQHGVVFSDRPGAR